MKAQWFSSLTSAQGKVVATNFFFSEAPGDLTVVSGPKVSGLTYKSRAKWKMLWGIYSAICGEVNVSVEKCVEIKRDYVEK